MRLDDRLFRYDRRIAVNATRATFPQWRDRLLALIIALIALAAVRAWFTDQSGWTAPWQAVAAGLLCGMSCGNLIRTRLAFHAADGPLAADALRRETRLRYVARWHLLAAASLAIVTLLVRAPLLLGSMAGYVAGMALAHGTSGLLANHLPLAKAGPVRTVRSWLRHPFAGAAAAVVMMAALTLHVPSLTAEGLATVAGIETALLVLCLTTVDDRVVRFMAIAGHDALGTILRSGRAAIVFLGLSVPICLLTVGQTVAAVVAAVGAAGLLLMALRTLAYRLHPKRSADILVMAMMAVLALAAFAMPIIFPVIVLAMMWRLHRRANARTWMLA